MGGGGRQGAGGRGVPASRDDGQEEAQAALQVDDEGAEAEGARVEAARVEEKGARRQGEEDLEEKGLVQNQESRVGLSECSKQGTSLMFQVCLSCFGLGKYTLVTSK